MHIGLAFFIPVPQDFYLIIGFLFCIIAYSIVANLFILVGLKYYFGPSSWFNRHVVNSFKQLASLSIITALIVAFIFLFLLIE